jgi:Protein of unknown function (DUF3025)
MSVAGANVDVWDADGLFAFPSAWPLWAVQEEFRGLNAFPDLETWNRHTDPQINRNEQGLPVCFVPHVARRRGSAWQRDTLYDGCIFLRGEIPSRQGQWHDYFNMCVWRAFPKAKAALNAMQWHALCRWLPEPSGRKLPGARRKEQDALALTDEGGVLLLVDQADAAEVSGHVAAGDLEWLEALTRRREGIALPFGHALYEHLMTGRGEVRGAVVVLGVEAVPKTRAQARALADVALANHLSTGVLAFRGAPGVSIKLAQHGLEA